MYNEISNLTIDGHIIGMLHRDLRTMKTTKKNDVDRDSYCFCKRCSLLKQNRRKFTNLYKSTVQNIHNTKHLVNDCFSNNNCSSNLSSLCNRFIKTTFTYGTRFFYRLGEVFVLGACLLSVLRIPTVGTAPVHQSAMELSGKPRWINPCNIDPSVLIMDENNISMHSQLQTLYLQTKYALDHAKHFRNDYVKHTFHVDFKEHHEAWKTSINYENWLPKINKSLDEGTPEEHLANIEFDSTLKDLYMYLQVFAAAFEQLTIDMKSEKDQFYQHFKEAFDHVNAVLCEYQVVMIERNITSHPDVTREVMSEDLRNMPSVTARNLRDWVIFREYMNTLEYAVDVLNHLTRKSQEK